MIKIEKSQIKNYPNMLELITDILGINLLLF